MRLDILHASDKEVLNVGFGVWRIMKTRPTERKATKVVTSHVMLRLPVRQPSSRGREASRAIGP